MSRLLVAVGPVALAAAAADRRASGKELVKADHWRDVLDVLAGAASALVVVEGDDLTYGAVESILDASVAAGVPVGILPIGRDGTLLGDRPQPPPPAPTVGAMFCQFRPRFECDTEFGREEAEEFLTRLSGGVEAAVFHAHGNGADIQVGSHVMCVQVDHLKGKPRPGDLTLLCQAGGPCRIEHLPSLSAFWGASAMRARIVVMVSCWGYHPADGVLNPEVLFGTALFRGSNVEAFIASTRVTFNTPELAQAALAFLELGGTAGELTLLLNRFPGTATPPYVCIGDPDVRVQAAVGRHACAPAGSRPAPAPTPEDASFDELVSWEARSRDAELPAEARAEILAAFGPVLKEGKPGRVTAQTRALVPDAPAAGPILAPVRRYRALTALVARHTQDLPPDEADAFWSLSHSGAATAELDAQWAQLQVRLLRRRGPEQLSYMGVGANYRNERLDGVARHPCGNRLFRITVEYPMLDGYTREECFCERCGPVADVPVGTPAPLLVADGSDGVRVVGSPWADAWVVAGVVPIGPSLLPASAPRLMSLSEPIPLPTPLPNAGRGRRLGVAIVSGGDHVLLQTDLPPFAPSRGFELTTTGTES